MTNIGLRMANVEELGNVVFDVPCPACGESTFILPYVPGAEHRMICNKCEDTFIVCVYANGSIEVYTEKEIKLKFDCQKDTLIENIVCEDCGSRLKNEIESHEITPYFRLHGTRVLVSYYCGGCKKNKEREIVLV